MFGTSPLNQFRPGGFGDSFGDPNNRGHPDVNTTALEYKAVPPIGYLLPGCAHAWGLLVAYGIIRSSAWIKEGQMIDRFTIGLFVGLALAGDLDVGIVSGAGGF